jgi:uncharacterized protein YdeI (YjbR/CyaY-like superfamily)
MATLQAADATAGDDKQILVVTGRADLRSWLAAHHTRRDGLWLVTREPDESGPAIDYDAIVEEALCVGWIDSQVKKLPDRRTVLWLSPRRKGSPWSRPNKQRVAALEEAGRMGPAGLAAVERAKADGTWTMFDSVEDLVVPNDLQAAFEENPQAREGYEAMPPSARKTYLGSLVLAKTPQTRARRVERIVTRCAQGQRP